MNLTNELQAEIRRVMDDYWARYFSGDLDAWLQFLPDDYRNIGSTEEEIWNSKEEVLNYSRAVIDQMAGNVDLRNKQVQVIPYPPYFMVHELGDLFIRTGEDWVFYAKFRLSSLIQKTDDGWKVLHQHGSFPDAKAQEGESIGFEKISRENQELREAVNRRTVELEYKNRELEIEAALERVRTQAMGMAKPDDVLNICQALFTELRSLGFGEIRNTLINFWNDEQGFMLDYDYSDFSGGHVTRIPYSDHPTFAEFQRQMRSATDAFVELVVRGEQLESWKARRRSIGEYEDPRLTDLPALYYYFYSIGVGAVGISTFAALPEEKRVVLKRFRNAFELAYRRYMDIVQAEAQAREAQVEVAVERVRAKALAMYKSEELLEVVATLRKELASLHIHGLNAATLLLEQEDGKVRLIDITQADSYADGHKSSWDFEFKLEEMALDVYFKRMWLNDQNYFVIEQNKKEIQAFVDWLSMFRPEDAEVIKIAVQKHTIMRMWHPTVSFEKGKMCIDLAEAPNVEVERILIKIGSAFGLAYTRFLDLQKAEAQTREARIEAALERVRSRTNAMQHSDELREAANVLFQQVQALGIPVWSCGYNIWEKEEKIATGWMCSENILQPSFEFPLTENPTFIRFFESRQKGEEFYVEEVEGVSLAAHYHYMNQLPYFAEILQGFLKSGFKLPTHQVHHVVNFSHGNLIFISDKPVPYAWDVFKRFASVFEQTYTRFLDLQHKETQARNLEVEKLRLEKTLTELRTTQAQLIQKEKLASLGELTAGIAHEIQNPLNFVNNFSEVSAELLAELEDEWQKPERDAGLEAELLGDLKQNLQKITHHGQRASGIVRGMLEHARSSTGERQPTDLNALADEYLRLAYHGFLAKYKDFSSELLTEFAPDLPLVSVIPPDLGRVLLNLLNNAFYAIGEKQKTAPPDYRPTVTVSTGSVGDTVEIRVRDNGTGIADAVKAKLFQPFFTTKPTGEGTGLGLSLSYDIITKGHGGSLTVTSSQNLVTEFLICLPA